MRLRDIIVCFVCFFGAIFLLVASSSRLERIHQMRKEMGFVSTAPEDVPPSLAFVAVGMGAFRGLVVDILWMRADALKEEGQFFDAKQLADWITVLQPRFPAVWDFQAWNMAYNISVAMPSSQWQERWKWVRNGYELLRDKGIEKNPDSIILYRSLAWIFQHKISGVTDDCHRHYKRQLALSMRPLLHSQQSSYRSLSNTVSPLTNEYFQALASTPQEFSRIASDAEVGEFIAALKEVSEEFRGGDEQFINSYLSLRQVPDRFDSTVFDVIDRFRGTKALEKFDTFAKAYHLRNEWKFDISIMQQINQKYGPGSLDDPNERMPLNWEHPDAHAIYWAQLGLERAGKKGVYSVDEKNTDRVIFHSLQSLYRTGKLIVYPIPGQPASIYTLPDLRMFDRCNEAWKKRIRKYQALEKGNPKAVRGGHKNMLINAVAMFYQAGHIAKAAKIYSYLRANYSTGAHSEDFPKSLLVFVRKRLAEELWNIGPKDAVEQIMMVLRDAYFRYAIYEDNTAFAREKWAKEVYTVYQKEKVSDSVEQFRMGLPAFDEFKYRAFVEFLSDPFFPEYLRKSLLGRIEVERPELLELMMKQENIITERMKNKNQQL